MAQPFLQSIGVAIAPTKDGRICEYFRSTFYLGKRIQQILVFLNLGFFPFAFDDICIHLIYHDILKTITCMHAFYTVTYTYINSLNTRGQVSIFKTLETRSAQSSAANFICWVENSKIKNLRCGFCGYFFMRVTKN